MTVMANSGHMTPISHLAEALKDAGHDVTVVTMDNEDGRTKGKRLFEGKGVKAVYVGGNFDIHASYKTNDIMGVISLREYVKEWTPHAVTAVIGLKPDIIVTDWYSSAGLFAAEQIGVPVVINQPGLACINFHAGFY